MREEGSPLDKLARDVAAGEVSRRTALRRFAGVALTAAVPGFLLSESALARCPKSRRCGDKCCPRNARCRHGKCKCKAGYTKCGRGCVDLETSVKHCGACGNACAEGKVCIAGECACTIDADCPGDPENGCVVGVCSAGTCTLAPILDGSPCDESPCAFSESCQAGVCMGTPVVCEPLDQCHEAGTCDPETGQCSNPIKPDGSPCNNTDLCTHSDTCQAGVCTGGSQVVCPPGQFCIDGTCRQP